MTSRVKHKRKNKKKKPAQPVPPELDMELIESIKAYRRKLQPPSKPTYHLQSYSIMRFK